MKKNVVVGALAFTFLLGGCSDAYTNVQNKNETVLTIGSQSVKKSELYDFLLANDGSNQVLEAVMSRIIENEIENTAELEAQGKENLDGLKTMLGEGFTDFIKGYGFDKEEDYFNEVIMYNLKSTKLVEKYIDSKFDTLSLTQKPRKVQIIEVKDKGKAKDAFDRIASGIDFAVVGKVFGTSAFSGNEIIVTSATEIDSVILAMIQATTDAKKFEEVIEAENGSFYLINIVEGDPEKFKEEAKAALAKISTITDEATRYYLKEAKFRIYDKTVYDQFKQSAPDLIFD